MKLSVGVLLNGAFWTLVTFGIGQTLRFITNVILTHIIAPELFGLMLIVNTLRIGLELTSDLGIGQAMIYSNNAEKPDFYNTAWSLQVIRGLVLWLVFILAAEPVAYFYNSPVLAYLLVITALITVFGGLASVAPTILQKQLKFAKLGIYTLIIAFISSVSLIALVVASPTVWSLAFAGVVGSIVSTVGSYFLLPQLKQKFFISKIYLGEIVNFGKWMFMSSFVFFLSSNFDRLYFAKVIPLELLGIYGIARTISEILSTMTARLGTNVVFPFITSHLDSPRAELRKQIAVTRARFLLLVGVGCSLFIATADLAIKLLFDHRYQAAGWMVPILIVGSWFSTLTSINECTLLGLGKPSYMALSNSLKFVLLIICLPISLQVYGLVGAIVAVTLIELCRYFPLFVGQRRENFSFGRQDLAATVAMLLLVGFWEWLRWMLGFGTSFDSFPVG